MFFWENFYLTAVAQTDINGRENGKCRNYKKNSEMSPFEFEINIPAYIYTLKFKIEVRATAAFEKLTLYVFLEHM